MPDLMSAFGAHADQMTSTGSRYQFMGASSSDHEYEFGSTTESSKQETAANSKFG